MAYRIRPASARSPCSSSPVSQPGVPAAGRPSWGLGRGESASARSGGGAGEGWTERGGLRPTYHRAPARHHPGPRMERADAAGGSACRWLCLEWQHLSEPVEGGLRDHRRALERAEILRPTRQAIERVLTMKAGSTKMVRCAIYTRVSTDQGLEQDFNL